jgi:hypothetical protein
MKTLNQYVDSLMISLKQVTDESYLSGKEDWLKDKLKDIRATLAREEYKSTLHLNPDFFTKLDLTIECDIKTATVGKTTITSSTKLARIELPTLLSNVGNAIKYCGDDDILSPGFNIVSLSLFNSSDAAPYTSMKPLCARIGNYLYFKNLPKGMVNATVIAALNDPTDDPNYKDTDAFPVPSGYKLELLAKQDIHNGWNIPLEVSHNENDDSIPNSKNMSNAGRSDQ